MKCINFECNKELTDYEIYRIKNPRKISKRFCVDCRGKRKDILFINCISCSSVFPNSGMRVLCDTCKYEHRKQKYNAQNMRRKEYYKVYQRGYRLRRKQILTSMVNQ